MDECLPAGLRLWNNFSKGMQIGVMIAAKGWCGKTGKFICPNEVIGIFRARMSSDEIPSCGTFRRFQSKPCRKMVLQVNVIFHAPAKCPFIGPFMPSPLEASIFLSVIKNLLNTGVKIRLRKILQSKNLLEYFRRKIQFVNVNLKNHGKTR